jgi:hypothetical protein
MRAYSFHFVPPTGGPMFGERTRMALKRPEQGALAVIDDVPRELTRAGAVIYERWGTSLVDANALRAGAETMLDVPINHPILLTQAEESWIKLMGEGLGRIMYSATMGEEGYENVTFALQHGKVEEDQRYALATLVGNLPENLPDDACTGEIGDIVWLIEHATHVYGVHGELLDRAQWEAMLKQHAELGRTFRRFYETQAKETPA